jgi:hypothetical protein
MSIEAIQEWVAGGGKIDTVNSVVRGVKLLGLESVNGRRYRPEAARKAIPLYEGAKVNLNHPKGKPNEPRGYEERFGAFRNVAYREGLGLYGDHFYNPKHPVTAQYLWDVEHAPHAAGFSHNVDAQTSREAGKVVVESIVRVRSVDLVADPATTHGFFESQDDDLSRLTVQELIAARPDIVTRVREEYEQQQREQIALLEAEIAVRKAAKAERIKEERTGYNGHKYHDPKSGAVLEMLSGLAAEKAYTANEFSGLLNVAPREMRALLESITPTLRCADNPRYRVRDVRRSMLGLDKYDPHSFEPLSETVTPESVEQFVSMLTRDDPKPWTRRRRWN